MKKVKLKRPIKHQGKDYKAGEVIETTEEHAGDLIRQGHAEEHKEEETIGSQHPPSGGTPPYPGKDPKQGE